MCLIRTSETSNPPIKKFHRQHGQQAALSCCDFGSQGHREELKGSKCIVVTVTNDISFHARVGRFSPFLYLRSVAIAVILFWLQLAVLVSPCFLGSRIPRDYRFPRAPLFLCSERKPSSLTTGSSKLQFGDRQTRVKTVHYSEDRNSRCDAT